MVTPSVEVICTAPPAPPGRLLSAVAPALPLAVMPSVETPTPVSVTLPAFLPAELALAVPPEAVIAPVTLSRPAAGDRA